MTYICPICGYDDLEEPPYDNDGDPSYEICSCCGFQYGFDDLDREYDFEQYRQKWVLVQILQKRYREVKSFLVESTLCWKAE